MRPLGVRAGIIFYIFFTLLGLNYSLCTVALFNLDLGLGVAGCRSCFFGFNLLQYVVLGAVENGQGVLDRVVNDVLYLKFVFVVGVSVGESTELLGQVETVGDVFRRDEVLGYLDAVVQVANLMRRTRWHEDRVTQALNDSVSKIKKKLFIRFFITLCFYID